MSTALEGVYGARPVAEADVQTRATFITRTYAHLVGAIALFTAIEVALFKTGVAETLAPALASRWWMVLGGFVLVSWVASATAHRARSFAAQYAALLAYVAIEALIFVPLLWVANRFAPGVIASAALVTGLGFVGLSGVVYSLRKDFSFLRGILLWAAVGAGLAIVASLIFGFQLGTWFSVLMVLVAGASILYTTSNVLFHYPKDRYVAASLELFAAVALMLWYVIRLFMSSRD